MHEVKSLGRAIELFSHIDFKIHQGFYLIDKQKCEINFIIPYEIIFLQLFFGHMPLSIADISQKISLRRDMILAGVSPFS